MAESCLASSTLPTHADAQVRHWGAGGHWDRATTVTLRHYGGEILGYLVAAANDRLLGEEAFALFCERTWRGLSGFEWRCSLRTWLYTVARGALASTLKARGRRARREVPVTTSRWTQFVHRSRTTRPHERARREACLQVLREQLDPADRELLILRLDRKMDWIDVARIVDPDAEPRRAAARLRKRYERAKRTMRRIAEREGLLDS